MLYRDLLFVCGNEDETRKALLKYHDDKVVKEMLDGFSFNERGWTVYDSENNAFFVWMPCMPKTAQDIGFLVHELFHATYAVFGNLGSPLSDDNEELFAYILGYVTEKTIEWVTSSV